MDDGGERCLVIGPCMNRGTTETLNTAKEDGTYVLKVIAATTTQSGVEVMGEPRVAVVHSQTVHNATEAQYAVTRHDGKCGLVVLRNRTPVRWR